jgi:hypothetical protein
MSSLLKLNKNNFREKKNEFISPNKTLNADSAKKGYQNSAKLFLMFANTTKYFETFTCQFFFLYFILLLVSIRPNSISRRIKAGFLEKKTSTSIQTKQKSKNLKAIKIEQTKYSTSNPIRRHPLQTTKKQISQDEKQRQLRGQYVVGGGHCFSIKRYLPFALFTFSFYLSSFLSRGQTWSERKRLETENENRFSIIATKEGQY